jgi:hypothetical protein
MIKTHKKRFDIALKAILLLCLSITVFGCLSQRGKIVVYLGSEKDVGDDMFCPDSFIIEDIKLRVKTGSKTRIYLGACMCATREGMLVRKNADTLHFMTGRPVKHLYLTTKLRPSHDSDDFYGENIDDKFYEFYEAIVNPAFLQRFNEILDAFEESPASCTYREPFIKTLPLPEPKSPE